MFAPERLRKLSPSHRLRKAALLLTELERAAMAGDEGALDRAKALARALAALTETPETLREGALRLAASPRDEGLRELDSLRHGLFRHGGQERADWDLLDPETGKELAPRQPVPGLRAWLEDIRSPFNVGSMLRSAEALGLEEAFLSPDSADPSHPRASRSAMGAEKLLPWRRAGPEVLELHGPAFALELGGTPLDEFPFPARGIVVVGSEELGVSSAALSRCSLGRVSIPMRGAKASINVGVAFGILLAAWVSHRARSS